MLATVIKIFGDQPKVDQLKLVQLIVLIVIAKIPNADVVWFEIVVDVANLMQVLKKGRYLNAYLPDGLIREHLALHLIDYFLKTAVESIGHKEVFVILHALSNQAGKILEIVLIKLL